MNRSSARPGVEVVDPASAEPTAVQSLAEVHETACRLEVVAPTGLGVGWIVQTVPFHVSPSVEVVLPLVEDPTATHDEADGHETPLRKSSSEGLGVAWKFQSAGPVVKVA
jgi:hypothetical protein